MTGQTIDHGDVVETRYTILVAADDPNVVILRPDLVPGAVERENVYFRRRHKDGHLCDGHLHESLDDARACIDRTRLDGLWQDLTRIMADIQRQVNAEFADYRKNGGTLGGDEWLEQRNQERNQPPKRRSRNAARSTSEVSTDSSARPTLRRMARRKKDVQPAEAGDRGPLPSQAKGETVQAIVRAGMSIVPAGGAVAELIDLVIKPALDRRREDWFNGLAADVQKLKERPNAPTIEELSKNDAFVTVMLNASAAAMRTHQQEKLDALRAAVINTALGMAPDEHTQLMFIRFVDELTALHLRILGYARNPASWFERNQIPKPDIYLGARSAVLEAALPELRGMGDIYNQAVNELSARGLISGSFSGMVSQQGLFDKLTSPLGDRFLAFITAPPA